MGPEFILNTLLSLGTFSTERKLLLNDTVRGIFNNSKLIGEEDDPKSLQSSLNQVMNIFVNNHLVLFPKFQNTIASYITEAGDLLYSFIINNEITISEMPAVQLLDLLLEHDNFLIYFKKNFKMISPKQKLEN